MKIILLGELKGKGGEGDVIDVAQGYAENYLFPNKIAVLATPGNLKQLEQRRNNIAKREVKRVADANALKEQLDGKNLLIDAKVGEESQLFGSVTSTMVADAIKEQLGIEFDRKRVELKTPIKVAGVHAVELSIYRDINATVNCFVGIKPGEETADEDEESEVVEEAVEAEETAEVAE